MADLARQAALETFRNQGAIMDNITMASEDFSEFSERVPGVFIFLGVGNPEKGTDIPHHNPRFNIDEEILISGVALLVRGARRFFEQAPRLSFLLK
jgi:amidohydrolase